jgi:hypothetical protein
VKSIKEYTKNLSYTEVLTFERYETENIIESKLTNFFNPHPVATEQKKITKTKKIKKKNESY